MGLLRGWLYCFLWYTSILSGYAGLFCPLFPILLLSNGLYRNFTDALFTFWQYYPTVLLERLCRCDIQVTGDYIETSEISLLVMNHRTRTDWNFLWPALYHCIKGPNKYCYPTKFVLKDIIRHIPGPGWVMQMACFLFIKRHWSSDRAIFLDTLDYFASLRLKYVTVVFPEGTDLTPSTRITSDLYALKHGLRRYQHVLHPRTTGFAFLAKNMTDRWLDAVYDVTLVYPDQVPQNEMALLKGIFPKKIRLHLVKYPVSKLPKGESALRDFLNARWDEKEETLRTFQESGKFPDGTLLRSDSSWELTLALYFWSFLPIVVLYCFCFVRWFRIMVFAHTILLVGFNITVQGYQNFEIALYKWKAKLFKRYL